MVINGLELDTIEMQPITSRTLIRQTALARLFAEINAGISYNSMSLDRHQGKGMPCIRFGRECYYTLGDARDFLEKKLGCTIREAVELGRITIPPRLGKLAWDSDGTPVEAKKAAVA